LIPSSFAKFWLFLTKNELQGFPLSVQHFSPAWSLEFIIIPSEKVNKLKNLQLFSDTSERVEHRTNHCFPNWRSK
jgi:hypothetical protein